MILDIQKFIFTRRADWDEFEALVDSMEGGRRVLELEEIRRFHYLYEKTAADLMRLKTFAAEPQTRAYLESLIARAYGEMHGAPRRKSVWHQLTYVLSTFPDVIRRHVRLLFLSLALFCGGMGFGAFALVSDDTAKPVLMPFSHCWVIRVIAWRRRSLRLRSRTRWRGRSRGFRRS